MRRLLIDAGHYLSGLGRAAVAGWNAFFFTPSDPTALGLIRLAVGLLLLRSLWVFGLDLDAFLGPHAWADPAAVRGWMADRVPGGWSFWLLVPEGLSRPTWLLAMAVLAMFAAGLFSRTTAVLAWIIVVSTARRAPTALYGFDQMISTWTLYLAISGASGQAVSLDRFLARWRANRRELRARASKFSPWRPPSGVPVPSVAANLGLRLIQLHLCLIYGMAGLAKLRGDAWWDGSAAWGVVAAGEFRRFDLTALASWELFLNAVTHAGLALELLYPALIWVPRLRPLILALVLGMHVGIDTFLGLTEFALAMVAGNLAFVSGPWLRSLAAGRAGRGPSATVLYDGACPKCRASMAVMAAADADRALAPIDLTAIDVAQVHPSLTPEACLRSMHVVLRGGRVVSGFDAVAAAARQLPLFWGAGVLAMVPGVAHLGRRAYNGIAARRAREAPCTDESCALPSHRPGK
jgi:predicted DCC family thiol-disulfide oxidoreductase YuxK